LGSSCLSLLSKSRHLASTTPWIPFPAQEREKGGREEGRKELLDPKQVGRTELLYPVISYSLLR
jgi:hypothetical protein